MMQPSNQWLILPKQRDRWALAGLLLFTALVGLYFVARYRGLWAESDSATFVNAIRAVFEEGRLVPARGGLYPNGYLYQALSTFILSVTGLEVATLQQIVYPLLVPMVALCAWVLYRELTGNAFGATLTTMFLFVQPELLFVILRSSHEKFTRALMLLCLFLLVRSYKMQSRPVAFIIHITLFYLTAYALIASNNLMGQSFIFAVAVAFLGGWVLVRLQPALRQQYEKAIPRLIYVTVTCVGLAFLFTFYVYPPALHDLLVLDNIWERVTALFLEVQAESSDATVTNPYFAVRLGWLSPQVYFLLSIANWLTLGCSLLIWAWWGISWLRGRTAPKRQAILLLWLLYGAFALQGGLSIIVDHSGALASNLQHRMFPSVALVAVAVIGVALTEWRPGRLEKPFGVSLAVLLACLSVLAVFKATNEPALSNKWTFYTPGEMAALNWSDANLQDKGIWSGFDERLAVAFTTEAGSSANGNRLFGYYPGNLTRSFVVSNIMRLRGTRYGGALPVPADALRVYDNGEAQLLHKRPLTPYQK